MTEPDLQTLLGQGIAAAKAAQTEAAPNPAHKSPLKRIGAAKTSQRERARQLLLQVTELDETNITAWLWLSTVMDSIEEKQVCLENVLTLDPEHKAARTGLARLDQLARSTPPKPEPATTSQPPLPQNNVAPPIQAAPAPPRQEKAPAPKSSQTSGFPCPFCHQTISALATTCTRCHLPLAMNCPACGAATDIEQPACAECGQALGNYRRGVTYFAVLAAAYGENKRSDDALKAWQAVEILKPAYPQLQLRLGEAQLEAGRPDRAMLNFERALEEDPDSAQVHFALADLWRQRGESQKAFTHLLRVTQLDPQHGLAWLRLGQLYERARRRQEANQAYRRAAALLADNSTESRQALQQLAQLQPSLPEAMATGWGELLRQMTGPVFICVLAALLDSGLRPWWIPWTGWLALFLAAAGAFLWISGTSLPRNPLIRGLLGEGWVSSAALRLPVAILGVGCWLLAFGIILLPLAGQSFPEPPTL